MIYYYILIIFFSAIIFFISHKIAKKFNLLDFPNKRKIHREPVANIAGLSIALIFLISVFLINFQNNHYNMILNFSLLIALAGFIDDRYNLNVGSKLIWQILPIGILVLKFDLIVSDLGNYQFLGTIYLGSFSYIFTIMSAFLLINATNYSDGIDGSAALTYLVSLINILMLSGDFSNEIIKFYIIISLPFVVFLFFNFSIFNLPKMFLGDSGSLLIGYILSFLMIVLYKYSNIHPIALAWGVSFLVYEFLSINLIRIIKNNSIFKAGQDHIHHIILKTTKSIALSNLILIGANFSLGLLGYFFYYFVSELSALIAFILTFFVYLFFRYRLTLNNRKK